VSAGVDQKLAPLVGRTLAPFEKRRMGSPDRSIDFRYPTALHDSKWLTGCGIVNLKCIFRPAG